MSKSAPASPPVATTGTATAYAITIQFGNPTDLAWFANAIHRQLEDREQQLNGPVLSIAMSALRRASGYAATLTTAELKAAKI